ncbi:TetR/AcrR family transcriptional regulator [Antrihabitans sp. YC3-6]|uniref:TetR/AcrR family transcriptional regulator n=1 Tax=Antrihabitans stalagmiti TaxID=2799499 RepID=A0A934U2Q8_9NOCA|nr:TetR/AcrR family transcriptional regulator [Antrihabitans stalagmiti]MBJ8339359.1 TetR/AcrR family transcriptional regulator [Antrihabitans stalagmiti]
MTSESTSARPYRSSLRAQQAEHTRMLIARAARERFVAQGWSGTTVRSVAESAGVSEATVYATFGNKSGLAIALIDSADSQADIARVSAELEAGAGDPAAQLRAMVGFDRRLFELSGDVIRIILEGRRQNDALDSAYREGRGRGDAIRREVFGSWPATTWRSGVDTTRALDIFAVMCSFETFDILRRERDWDADRIESWWYSTLCELLFRPPS